MTFKTPLKAFRGRSPPKLLMSFFPFCEKLTHKKIARENCIASRKYENE